MTFDDGMRRERSDSGLCNRPLSGMVRFLCPIDDKRTHSLLPAARGTSSKVVRSRALLSFLVDLFEETPPAPFDEAPDCVFPSSSLFSTSPRDFDVGFPRITRHCQDWASGLAFRQTGLSLGREEGRVQPAMSPVVAHRARVDSHPTQEKEATACC